MVPTLPTDLDLGMDSREVLKVPDRASAVWRLAATCPWNSFWPPEQLQSTDPTLECPAHHKSLEFT